MTFVPQDWSNCFLCDGTSTLNHQSDLLNSWESPKMYPPELYSGPTIQSRSAVRRAAQDLVFQIKCSVSSMIDFCDIFIFAYLSQFLIEKMFPQRSQGVEISSIWLASMWFIKRLPFVLSWMINKWQISHFGPFWDHFGSWIQKLITIVAMTTKNMKKKARNKENAIFVPLRPFYGP